MQDSLRQLLGGRRGALDASLPPLAFVIGWLVSDQSIAWGAGVAVAVGVVVGAVRLAKGHRVTAVVASVATVAAGALIALYTGRAQDFFLIQLLANIASALAWAVSILIRWPLLGLVAGVLLGQKTRWHRDPDLVRAYGRASWVWVFLQYTVRVLVYGILWLTGSVVALGVARVALSWPLVVHPGFRHPRG
jgi:hypothetical protein